MAAEPGDAAASGIEAPPLADAPRDLAYAVKALQLYPASSPVVGGAVGRAHQVLQPFLREGRLTLSVLPDSLCVGRFDVAAGSRSVGGLADRLHRRGVAHLHLDAGMEPTGLQHLAELLATDPETLKEEGGISGVTARRPMTGISFELLQLERLFEDEEVDSHPDAEIWKDLLGGYSDEAELESIDWDALAENPQQLSDFLGWLLDSSAKIDGISEMSRVQLVRAVCTRVGEAAAARGDDCLDNVAGVFGRCYDRLDKEVWIELLGQPLPVGAEASPASIAKEEEAERMVRAAAAELSSTDLAHSIGATLTREQVEDLLVYALSTRQEASPRIFGLFQRLLEVRSERDAMEQAIRDKVERLVSKDDDRRTFADLWPQLADAIHGENPDQFVSANYKASLGQLLIDDQPTSVWDTDVIHKRMREMEPNYLVQRKVKIILEVVKAVTDNEQYEQLALELERALPELIVSGQYIATEEILRDFSDHLMPTNGRPDRQRQVALDILIRFCNQHTLREVVRNLAGKQRTQIDAATTIFRSLGPMAVAPLLEALAQEGSRPIRVHLVRMLAAIGDQALPEIKKHLRDKRWFFVRNLVWIIGEIGDPGFIRYLRVIIEHSDVRVRREAVRALGKLENETAADVLIDAIDDEDDEVSLLAIRGLGHPGGRIAAPRLRKLLRLPNFLGQNTETIRAAAIAIARIGDGRSLPTLRRIPRNPFFFRSSRAPAGDAAAWAVATLQGEVTGEAPEAALRHESRDDGHAGEAPPTTDTHDSATA